MKKKKGGKKCVRDYEGWKREGEDKGWRERERACRWGNSAGQTDEGRYFSFLVLNDLFILLWCSIEFKMS